MIQTATKRSSKTVKPALTLYYQYMNNRERWAPWPTNSGIDIRTYSAPAGWRVTAELLDYHPINGRPLKDAPQWWIGEFKVD